MKAFVIAVLAATAGTAQAQHGGYAGQESRDIKALSPEEITQYRSGAGMGYARAAELNHFPGPMHVLELAEQLALSEEQLATTRKLMDQHKREARSIGTELLDAERALEALFRQGSPDEAALARAVREAAALQGEYRLAHLETHRRMRAVLTDEQVKRYDALRGHSSPETEHKHRH